MDIFVVSLKEATDRRSAVSEQLRNQNLDFQFVDAVDGTAGLPSHMESQIDRDLAYRKLGRHLTDPEFGCALSHAFLYKRMLEDGIEEAIILEDDVELSPDFAPLVSSGRLSQLKRDLVLLYSEGSRAIRFSFRALNQNHRYFSFAMQPNSTAAYYVTLKGARKLLRAALPISMVADWPLLIPFRMRCSGIYPFPAYPRLDDSAINQGRTESRERSSVDSARKLWTELLRGDWRRVVDILYFRFLMPLISVEVR